MARFLIILGSFFVFSAHSFALLPPAWQSVAELKAILNAKELSDYLDSGAVIESIEKKERGWEIKTNHAVISIKIQSRQQSMPGPEKFTLQFSRSEL